MFTKLATATLLSGALSVGTAGVAFGANSGSSSGGRTSTHHHLTCADAPQVMDRIQKVQARIAAALPKLQTREDQALEAGHKDLAARLAARISRLDKVQAKTTKVVARIEKACPNTATVSPGSTGSAPSAPAGATAA